MNTKLTPHSDRESGMAVGPPPTANGRGARVPPHDLAAERALLGAMLLTSDAVADAVELTSAGDFYRPAHKHVFDAIAGLYAAGEPADTVTVAAELERVGFLGAVGGAGALVEMQASTPVAGNAARYAVIVAERATLRRLIGAGGEVAELGYSQPADVDATVDEAEAVIFAVAGGRDLSTMMEASPLVDAGLEHLDRLAASGGDLTGTSTGLVDLDHMLLGLQPSTLVVVGARPSMGKTSLALGIAAAAAMSPEALPVLFFSLEMSSLELSLRLLAGEGHIASERIRAGRLEGDDWARCGPAAARIAASTLAVDDNPNTSVLDIRAKARRRHAAAGGLGLVVVDYLQLMGGRAGVENRQIEVSEFSRGLKILARELECPILALSQLNRSPEGRTDKRPLLSDLRDSGAIEQDADVVMFLYRDEMYNADTADRGIAEVHIAKHRTGPTGTVKLAWLPHYTRFENLGRRGGEDL